MYKLFCLVVIMVVLVSGCGSNNKRVSDKDHYAEDGYMGLSSANPSLVATPNSHNYADDIEAMKRALREVPNIRKTRIIFDGGFAYIHIHVVQGLSREETEVVSEQAQRKLSEMSPQYYKIRVTVDR
ncbi:MAG: hypothetical protein WDZ91_10305 [Paenibacillaceae bacterium]